MFTFGGHRSDNPAVHRADYCSVAVVAVFIVCLAGVVAVPEVVLMTCRITNCQCQLGLIVTVVLIDVVTSTCFRSSHYLFLSSTILASFPFNKICWLWDVQVRDAVVMVVMPKPKLPTAMMRGC